MKWIQRILFFAFFAVLAVPLVFFNFKSDQASAIDNRKLAENPFEGEGDLTENIENYVNDRIGLRDEMITGYTILNDKLFGEMEHPSYTYGKDGYVFGSGLSVGEPNVEYMQTFALAVKKMQTYCIERGVPFVFVLNPAKPAVYTEYIKEGINYNRRGVEILLEELDGLGVRYVDNTLVLRAQKEAGEKVFNQKYDANHWNGLGAYYGTKSVLQELKKDFPAIPIMEKQNLSCQTWTAKSLLVSKFPINEEIYEYTVKGASITDITEKYQKEIELHPSFQSYSHSLNDVYKKSPKALVFQGSYMNVYGRGFFASAFGEYVSVHDYQNVLNLPYYYNIYKPDCVVFEVAEYTLDSYYFNYGKMKSLEYNPSLSKLSQEEKAGLTAVEEYTVETGVELTKICFQREEGSTYAWLEMRDSYDMIKTETGYEVTLLTADYEAWKDKLKIWVL